MTPQGIQRSRAKGWRMPPNTVVVSRPSIFGNPWILGSPGFVMMGRERIQIGPSLTAAGAVARYRCWLAGEFGMEAGAKEHRLFGLVMVPPGRQAIVDALPTLRGKNLSCWCAIGEPCHRTVLLELANASKP